MCCVMASLLSKFAAHVVSPDYENAFRTRSQTTGTKMQGLEAHFLRSAEDHFRQTPATRAGCCQVDSRVAVCMDIYVVHRVRFLFQIGRPDELQVQWKHPCPGINYNILLYAELPVQGQKLHAP
jgi:hypothetical protein